MKPDEIRELFLRFFEEKGHKRVPGAPLVPPGDPTLLFTSAGMVQFKPYFMGQAKPPHPRLTSVQKCFRTSDIDEVGDTAHLTFFEMLGNFSVGDYFKKEAVPWAWEFVTSKEWLGLDPQRLWAAVYLDDDEAFDLWRAHLPEERIRRYGEEHNYWFSGEIGPCGPCSEIHYDFGEALGCGPDCEPSHDGCDRFLEIWNLVFMSYYCDGAKRDPLPSTNIDTGAGLERMAEASLFESPEWPDKSARPSVYRTELFAPVIQRIEELSGKRYGEDAATDRAMRIVAEHARAVTFLIGDERTPVIPSNEERGYAVRRVLRRAVYFLSALGRQPPGLATVATRVMDVMAGAYPALLDQAKTVVEIVEAEEKKFASTLERGRVVLTDDTVVGARWLQSAVKTNLAGADSNRGFWATQEEGFWDMLEGRSGLPKELTRELTSPHRELLGSDGRLEAKDASALQAAAETPLCVTGRALFLLWDTYGFPADLTKEIALKQGFSVHPQADVEFQAEMEKQRQRGRAAAKGAEAVAAEQAYASLGVAETVFRGYETLEAESEAVAVLRGRRDRSSDLSRADLQVGPYEVVQEASAGAEVEVFLAETPFYPEGGGQVGDRGEIVGPNGRMAVEDTRTVAERLIVHRGRVVEGRIAVGDRVTARVDPRHRADTMRNHTGTHLLHAALRAVLGTHVRQAGSLVAPDHLRFDFTHTEPLTPEQTAEVQALVNEKVRQDLPVDVRTTSYDAAMSEGVLAFFGEKYGEEVRVVEVNSVAPRFSAELCGGTHCHRTGEVGLLVVTGESSIGAGMRRIEALTGRAAEEHVWGQAATLDDVAQRLGAPLDAVAGKLEAVLAEQDALRKKVERLERALASGGASGQRETYRIDRPNGQAVSISAGRVEATSDQALRFMGDTMKREMNGPSAAVIGAVIDERPQFLAVASEEAVASGLRADALVREVAGVAGGGGGGRPEMATGGGKDPAKLEEALRQVPEIARRLLNKSK